MMEVPSHSDAVHLFQKKGQNIKNGTNYTSKIMQSCKSKTPRNKVRMVSRNRNVLLPVKIALIF